MSRCAICNFGSVDLFSHERGTAAELGRRRVATAESANFRKRPLLGQRRSVPILVFLLFVRPSSPAVGRFLIRLDEGLSPRASRRLRFVTSHLLAYDDPLKRVWRPTPDQVTLSRTGPTTIRLDTGRLRIPLPLTLCLDDQSHARWRGHTRMARGNAGDDVGTEATQ